MVKNILANARDTRGAGLILESGRSPGGGNANPVQYSCLGNLMDRQPAGYSPWGRKRVSLSTHAPHGTALLESLTSFKRQTKTNFYFTVFFFLNVLHINGEGNGNPLQHSCLENPVDRGAWRAALRRVA